MPLELYPGKHLFVDDFRIEDMSACRRVLNSPEKCGENPVMSPEHPWEEIGIDLGHVVYDHQGGCLRAWYTASASTVIGTRVLVCDNPPSPVYETQVCYAESTDAIHWERPDVGIAEQEGIPAITSW